MKSLLLDRTVWDLVLDTSGNIAVASDAYSLAQDVACACKLFQSELWYATNKGVPYFSEILGHWPPLPVVKAELVKAAMTVPGVVSAQVVITSLDKRTLTGQVQFVDTTGAANNVSF